MFEKSIDAYKFHGLYFMVYFMVSIYCTELNYEELSFSYILLSKTHIKINYLFADYLKVIQFFYIYAFRTMYL